VGGTDVESLVIEGAKVALAVVIGTKSSSSVSESLEVELSGTIKSCGCCGGA
jgi:hypothetical protein